MNLVILALEKQALRDMKKQVVKAENNYDGEEVTTLETEEMSCSSGGSFSDLSIDRVVIEFKLHPELKRNMTQAQVNRISFYNVILEINKEVALMVYNNSTESNPCASSKLESAFAAIDEEEWLLAAITPRSTNNEVEYTGLKPYANVSFNQNIVQKEVPSNIDTADNEESRSTCTATEQATLLWKPNGSWWIARSKKNPKLELKNHNKRWSYLWPMINYHKLLARYIKKLKGTSNNNATLLSLLQNEIFDISRQLAKASEFTAAQWIEKLAFFDGWVSTYANDEEYLRQAVSELHVKSFSNDTLSSSSNNEIHQKPLQLDNIDEYFSKVILRAQESQKDSNTENSEDTKKSSDQTKNSVQHGKSKKDKKGRNLQQRKFSRASSKMASLDYSSHASSSSTPTCASFSHIMGAPLPMICSYVVSPITPIFCPFPSPVPEMAMYPPSVVSVEVFTNSNHIPFNQQPPTFRPPIPNRKGHPYYHADGSVHYPI